MTHTPKSGILQPRRGTLDAHTQMRQKHSATRKRRPVRWISAAQFARLLTFAEHNRDRKLWLLMFDAGLRLGEALAVRPQDLHPRARTLTVRAQKSPRRLAPATERLAQAIKHDLSNRHPTPRTVQRRLATAALKARLGRITPHHLRHSFATRALYCGIPTDAIALAMGHRGKGAVTRLYLHPGPDMIAQIARAFTRDEPTQ